MDRHESVTASQTSSSASVDKFVNKNPGQTVRRVASVAGLVSVAVGAGACVTQVKPTETIPPETGAVDPAAVTKPPEEVHETQTAVAEETDTAPTATPKPTKTPEETKTPVPTPEPTINKEAEWVAMGFLPDYTKNGGTLSYKTENVNGTEVELVGFRVGQTEVWVDKNLVDLEADFALGGTKFAGETIIPDPNKPESKHIAKIGAFVHAANLGLVEKYGDKWYEEYIKYIDQNPDASYVLKGQAPLPGDPETYSLQYIGTVDAAKPIRFVFLEPKMEQSEAMDRPDRIMGGDSRAPFKLQYANRTQGYYGINIKNGELEVLTSEFLFDGKLLSRKVGGPNVYSLATIAGIESSRDRLSSLSTPDWFKTHLYKEAYTNSDRTTPNLIWAQK